MMHDPGRSDRPIVPANLPNKGSSELVAGHGRPYTGTKAETPDTDKGMPTATATSTERTAEEGEGRGLAKGNLQQQNMLRMQGRERMHSALERVREAVRRGEKQFTSLLHHIYNEDTLREAYFRLQRDAAAGVDEVTWCEYGEALEENLRDLSARLRRGAYRARPVRRVYIPKADGRQRPLGVPALEDKIVQLATVLVLNVIYEEDFVGFSYGFRPGRSQHNALDALYVGLERRKVNWVLDADIRGFFDAIDHGWMVKFLEHRIADRHVVRLIQKWLNAGVLEDGEWRRSEQGTPQGGSISPLLANLYLHYAFDLWADAWRRKNCKGDVIIVRYADDFVVGFEHRAEAEAFLAALHERMAKFALSLHPDKTRLIEFGRFAAQNRQKRGLGRPETFNFLGFTHCCGKTRDGRFVVKRRTIAKRMSAKLKQLAGELRRRMHDPIPDVGRWLASVLTGHYRYYGVPLNYRALAAFHYQVVLLWKRALGRRSQKGAVTWERLRRLIQRWLPRPRIYHPFPGQRLVVTTQGRSRVR